MIWPFVIVSAPLGTAKNMIFSKRHQRNILPFLKDKMIDVVLIPLSSSAYLKWHLRTPIFCLNQFHQEYMFLLPTLNTTRGAATGHHLPELENKCIFICYISIRYTAVYVQWMLDNYHSRTWICSVGWLIIIDMVFAGVVAIRHQVITNYHIDSIW